MTGWSNWFQFQKEYGGCATLGGGSLCRGLERAVEASQLRRAGHESDTAATYVVAARAPLFGVVAASLCICKHYLQWVACKDIQNSIVQPEGVEMLGEINSYKTPTTQLYYKS